jgi:hypothetical protein
MDIAIILTKKFPDSEWVLDGNAYAGLTWLSEGNKPTESQLQNLWSQVQSEIESEKQAKIDAKASAITKLKALGLSIDEVEAAFGLTETETPEL